MTTNRIIGRPTRTNHEEFLDLLAEVVHVRAQNPGWTNAEVARIARQHVEMNAQHAASCKGA